MIIVIIKIRIKKWRNMFKSIFRKKTKNKNLKL